MTPQIVTVVQARRGSTRLPDKVLMPVLGQPLLLRMLERVRQASLAGQIVVATTTDPDDDAIEALCASHGYACFRGSPTDLLDRHFQAGRRFGADAVVKIPSDVPLIDPAVIDRVLGAYLAEPDAWDFVTNLRPATYPDGNDVEVMRWSALAAAWAEAAKDYEREHTTPFIWSHPERFRVHNVPWETGLDFSMSHRWTIDYREDYDFIVAVYEALYPTRPRFGLDDILTLLEQRPEIAAINAKYAGVNWYRHHLDDLAGYGIDASKTRFADDES